MKNEQIVTWFEELIPEVKKSGDPKNVFLKFASDKNLSPALLEKLGHVYNTAKTVNYLDKSASDNRGSSFVILDVPDLLETYQKKAGTDHKYDNYGFEERRISSDLFELDTPFKVNQEPMESYEEIKAASKLKSTFKEVAVNDVNKRHYTQLKFELKEDLRDVIEKFASELRSTDVEFEDVERDANYYFEGAAKEACEFLAKNMKSLHVSVKRADDSGDTRIVEDYKALNMVGQTQKLLLDLDVLNRDDFKSAHVQEEEVEEEKESAIDKFFFEKSAFGDSLPGVDDTDTKKRREARDKKEKNEGGDSYRDYGKTREEKYPDSPEGSRPLKSLNEAFMPTLSAAAGAASKIGDLYEEPNKGQKDYDIGMEEMEHASILQNLLTSDEILADEDPEKVIDAYNTLRQLAPRLAADINIARVTLRSMIQHDGVSIFDANQFSKAEGDKQKVDANIRAQERLDYGTKAQKEKTQIRLS